MRIAAIEHYPTSTKGGSEKAFFEVLSALKSKGNEIMLFYMIEGDLILQYQLMGIQCLMIPSLNTDYFSLRSWKKLFKAAIMINQFKPACIYINQLADSPLAVMAKFLRKTKIICHLRVPKIGNSRLFNLAGKKIDRFISVNTLIEQQYADIFKEYRIVVINDGILIKKCHPLKEKKNYTAAYLGRISPEKGLMELVGTWAVLNQLFNQKVRLTITGPASSEDELKFKEELKTKIKSLYLEEQIILQPPVSNPVEFFKQYDFSVFPSTINEAFGRTIPESILAGTPVFARRVGIVEEILAPAKKVFVYDTEKELADKIVLFYQNKIDCHVEELQNHIVKKYDVYKNVLLIEKTIKELVTG